MQGAKKGQERQRHSNNHQETLRKSKRNLRSEGTLLSPRVSLSFRRAERGSLSRERASSGHPLENTLFREHPLIRKRKSCWFRVKLSLEYGRRDLESSTSQLRRQELGLVTKRTKDERMELLEVYPLVRLSPRPSVRPSDAYVRPSVVVSVGTKAFSDASIFALPPKESLTWNQTTLSLFLRISV